MAAWTVLCPNAHAGEVFDHAVVVRFDGTAWQRFLDGHSVPDIDVGPGGAVWVRASAGLEEGLGDFQRRVTVAYMWPAGPGM